MSSLPRDQVMPLPAVPPAVRPPRAPSPAVLLALLAAAAASGCATTLVGLPKSYEKMPLASFADALGYGRAFDADPNFLTATVRSMPWSRARIDFLARTPTTPEGGKQQVVIELREEFQRWCRDNGGEDMATPEVEGKFSTAALEYVFQLNARDDTGHTARSEICTTKEHSILAGYVNVDNDVVAFYDAASARAFVATFEPMAKARQEAATASLRAAAAAKAERTQAEKSADPRPDQEAWRTEVAARIARVMVSEGIARGRFEYLGNCLVQITTDRTYTVSLRSLDHALLTNVEWNDTGTVLGVMYRIVISDQRAEAPARVYMGSANTAQQVVTGLENLGHSCGAF